MGDQMVGVSKAFQAFLDQAPGHSSAWMAAVQALDEANALDRKTGALHTCRAGRASPRKQSCFASDRKQAGASDEAISALLMVAGGWAWCYSGTARGHSGVRLNLTETGNEHSRQRTIRRRRTMTSRNKKLISCLNEDLAESWRDHSAFTMPPRPSYRHSCLVFPGRRSLRATARPVRQ
jgi:hypothetical protein